MGASASLSPEDIVSGSCDASDKNIYVQLLRYVWSCASGCDIEIEQFFEQETESKFLIAS